MLGDPGVDPQHGADGVAGYARLGGQVDVVDGGCERDGHADTPQEGVRNRAAMGSLIVTFIESRSQNLGRSNQDVGAAFAFPDPESEPSSEQGMSRTLGVTDLGLEEARLSRAAAAPSRPPPLAIRTARAHRRRALSPVQGALAVNVE